MDRPGLRLLVKARAQPQTATLEVDGRALALRLAPLFTSIGRTGPGLAAAGDQATWQIATAPDPETHPWDACHALATNGLGIGGDDGVAFAEPDLEQQWRWTTPSRQALGMQDDCERSEPQNPDVYAVGPGNFWYREADFAQLAAAAQAVGAPAAAARIRIAHLDTGYDPHHAARPRHLRTDLQRNFADDDRPEDATDRATAIVNPMFGHGTGTIGLLAGELAGELLGGAARLEVVPIRVANWVVLFRNSAIAQAFDYVHGLWDRPRDRVHVVTLSMGGIASVAWADAVNALYERGIFVVAAAGNNFGNLPTRHIVYPARFDRVLAACGVMADRRPYADLPRFKMAGCYGPSRKQATALAAFTPNVPWARFGCPDGVDWDGGGTSAATPQVAAAAALWMQHHAAALAQYPAGWMRVEAARKALFDSAETVDAERAKRLGRGILRARAALDQVPAPAAALRKRDEDSASFGLFRVLTGLGVDARPTPQARMLDLEALQLSQQSPEIERILDGLEAGDDAVDAGHAAQVMAALADHARASRTLKAAVAAALHRRTLSLPAPGEVAAAAAPEAPSHTALAPPVDPPAARKLRVFAFDPLVATRLETLDIHQATVKVRWEGNLAPGPVGEYLEVVDVDPASGHAYAPIDLDAPEILAQDGIRPSEGHPQFHQQMVYAVAMKTVEHFEYALGRSALWAERIVRQDGVIASRFVRRLRIYPHALREANAYYSPEKAALLFGYFSVSTRDPGDNLPGGLIFTCLSHDIVAHETTHALLDGLHRRYKEPTNVDALAFHEAFSDIVALFQHFTLTEALHDQIARTRGRLDLAQLLGGLAFQFGQGIGNRGALRSAIGGIGEDGKFRKAEPNRTDYQASDKPHARGAVLVAAVFDAFLQIYQRSTEDLFRLASAGTGILPEGDIPHDLVGRLAAEASRVAGRILNVCIRALDYCPPVDLTFGEYLRAIITADRDLVPQDEAGYRVAFISAFRARGIFPAEVRNLSVDALTWQAPDMPLDGLKTALASLDPTWRIDTDRYAAYQASNRDAATIYGKLMNAVDADVFAALGLVKTDREQPAKIDGVTGTLSKIEVHSVRPARRIGPDGQQRSDIVIEITQRWRPDGAVGPAFRGGCTVICDLATHAIRYVIRKRVGQARRTADQQAFRLRLAEQSLQGIYFDVATNPHGIFAMLHRD